METNTPNISEKDRDSILNHIIDCANSALQNEDAFQKAMLGLASELRRVFDSEYCSIGIVIDEYAEDCFISFKESNEQLSNQQKESLESVKRVNIKDDSNTVSLALQSDHYAWFKEEEMDALGNYTRYKSILQSKEVRNSCVIPIRDKSNHNYGFIQLINTQKLIDDNRDVLPFNDAFIGLVQVIINYKKYKIERSNRLKDADFYSKMQDKRDNVDELLDSIMEYFSEEFNAAIVSFRIPILNGHKKEPLFYLRSVFVHPSIKKREKLKQRYFEEWREKSISNMPGVDQLRCCDQGRILESTSAIDFSQFGLKLYNNTLIIPIFRDFEPKYGHSKCTKFTCNATNLRLCKERFKRLYGVFRLRISKIDLSNLYETYQFDLDETKERLSYLSKQISLLLNSIDNRHENLSLQIFQDELRNSSFTKIKDYDERCVEIIKESVHAKVCSIYRYDDRTKLLTLNATTANTIKFRVSDRDVYFESNRIKSSCFVHINALNNVLARVCQKRQCEYLFNILDHTLHQSAFIEFIKSDNRQETAMAIPMIKKDGTCAGVVLLLGKDKDDHKHSISTAYWEHDIDHIVFIVNMLTRISESDSERLTFLAQLSHELLAPVTELVYDNDLIVNTAERNIDGISKRQLIAKIQENIDRNLLFKYIINDTKFIYSSTGRAIDYNIVKQEKPQDILLDAIRLLEKEAHMAKGLFIKTYISEMPPLYFDKERMMQVFLNLLKNAIRYADKHTEISISYNKRDDGFHEISFADVGIGVQEKEKETIFELFYRGEEAIEKIPRGTGMGLYIVRDIMRAHGGDCYVRRLDNPTEFAITLPNKE